MQNTAKTLNKHGDAGAAGDHTIGGLVENISHSVYGQTEVIELSLAALFCGGHILLEGPPGVGKTSLAKAIASSILGNFSRIQMTSDMLPSDIFGVLRPINADYHDFELRKGPVFANVVLADELNRTTPKTQAALLEAMAENTISVDGKTYDLPDPFFVIGTQNPIESYGVYPLSESQLDRFTLQAEMKIPEKNTELEIYANSTRMHKSSSGSSVSVADIVRTRETVSKVHVNNDINAYVYHLVNKTRSHSDILHGISVRGGLQMLACARALAFLRGNDFVTPDEIKTLAVPAMAHRIYLNDGTQNYADKKQIIQEIVDKTPCPK